MDTLADAVPPPVEPTGRSFALLDEAERSRLGALLRPLPLIDGLITAAIVAPTVAGVADAEDAVTDWLGCIWSREHAAEIERLDLPQTAAIVDPVLAHYAHVADSLLEEPGIYRPYLPGEPVEAASLWAAGFWGGVSLNAEAWAPVMEDEDALPLMIAILSLVRDDDMPEAVKATSPFRDMPPERREHMRHSAVEMLPEIVLALSDYALGLEAGEAS